MFLALLIFDLKQRRRFFLPVPLLLFYPSLPVLVAAIVLMGFRRFPGSTWQLLRLIVRVLANLSGFSLVVHQRKGNAVALRLI